MIVTITDDFFDIIPDEGYELYSELYDIHADRITAPYDSDLSLWIEQRIPEELIDIIE